MMRCAACSTRSRWPPRLTNSRTARRAASCIEIPSASARARNASRSVSLCRSVIAMATWYQFDTTGDRRFDAPGAWMPWASNCVCPTFHKHGATASMRLPSSTTGCAPAIPTTSLTSWPPYCLGRQSWSRSVLAQAKPRRGSLPEAPELLRSSWAPTWQPFSPATSRTSTSSWGPLRPSTWPRARSTLWWRHRATTGYRLRRG